MIVGSRIRIAPIAVFVAIAFGAWLWGAAGALVATPTLIVGAAFVRRLNASTILSQPAHQREGSEEIGNSGRADRASEAANAMPVSAR